MGTFGRDTLGELFPGFAVVLAVALTAVLVQRVSALSMISPLMLAVLLGIVIGNWVRLDPRLLAGIAFANRRLLRIAIVLLGLQLSVVQIVGVGPGALLIVVSVVAASFLAIVWIGSLFGVDPRLAELFAAGTSICGASAVAAMSTVNEANEEDVAYAMAAVTLLGTLLMFILPLTASMLGLNTWEFAIWAGSSIYEVAQVTGSAFQWNDLAGEISVVVKLTRVLMLAPVILVCGVWLRNRKQAMNVGKSAPVVPLFVVGFAAAVVINSLIPIPVDARMAFAILTMFLMSMALAALGLQTDVRKLMGKGLRPLTLSVVGTAFIVCLSLVLIKAVGWLAI